MAGVRQAIEKVGARVVYLPPYSPDFNPIEKLFGKLKHLVRTAALRSVEALWNLPGRLMDAFPPDECLDYLRHCGYTWPSWMTMISRSGLPPPLRIHRPKFMRSALE